MHFFNRRQWRNEPKDLGGHNLCDGERSDQARVWEGGVPPPTLGSFFNFRLENVQSGAYLRRKFRLDDMYYMGKRVTIRPIGKYFSWTRKHNYANMHPRAKTIFAKFQIHAMNYITYNILIWMRYPDVETRERAWRGCDAVGSHSMQCSFLLLLMVWSYINNSIPTNTNIEQMYVYASERSEPA